MLYSAKIFINIEQFHKIQFRAKRNFNQEPLVRVFCSFFGEFQFRRKVFMHFQGGTEFSTKLYNVLTHFGCKAHSTFNFIQCPYLSAVLRCFDYISSAQIEDWNLYHVSKIA